MTMRENKNYDGFGRADPLGLNDERPTARSVDEDTYGGARADARRFQSRRLIARPVDIFSLFPDPTQPRRALPSAVRQYWRDDPADLPALIEYWIEAALQESGLAYDVAAMLAGDGDRIEARADGSERAPGPLEAALLRLLDLAASIRRDGLLNPITIAMHDRYNVIETGERRWLAFHLLHARLADEQWRLIPAVVVTPNVWRQAAENNARDNLNAVGRARQYALLMMDLHKDDVAFAPYQACATDRAFYAQVLELRVPAGASEKLLSALGATDRSRLSRCRRVLELPDDEWVRADDENVSERELLRARNNGPSERENEPKTGQKPPKATETQRADDVERLRKSLAGFDAGLDKLERRIATAPDVDFSLLAPDIDARIKRLQRLKKRIGRRGG